MKAETARIAELEQETARLEAVIETLTEEISGFKQKIAWFERQIFGSKSERRLDRDPSLQRELFEALGLELPPERTPVVEEVAVRRRPAAKTRDAAVNDSGLRFDETVPVETIVVEDPSLSAIPEDERVVVGEKTVLPSGPEAGQLCGSALCDPDLEGCGERGSSVARGAGECSGSERLRCEFFWRVFWWTSLPGIFRCTASTSVLGRRGLR